MNDNLRTMPSVCLLSARRELLFIILSYIAMPFGYYIFEVRERYLQYSVVQAGQTQYRITHTRHYAPLWQSCTANFAFNTAQPLSVHVIKHNNPSTSSLVTRIFQECIIILGCIIKLLHCSLMITKYNLSTRNTKDLLEL